MEALDKALILIGDSALDNSLYITQGENNVHDYLVEKKHDATIVNLSGDGFTLDNILNGFRP